MYTIPTLSRTAMHYAYNTDTTDEVPDGLLSGVTLFDKSTVSYSYDYLQRLSNKLLKSESGTTLLEERFAYSTNTEKNTTTNRVSTKRVFWNNAPIHQFQHGYDALGNITNIYDAVTLKRVNYTYDDQGQLLTATHYNNSTKTHTETYNYDNVGNILTFNNGTTSHTYTYGDTQWQDLLTAVDGNEITYDASGNPTEYYNNWTMTWAEGRRLESVTIGGQIYTYQYNADGQRTKKTNPDGSYVEYHVMNGVTVGESHFTAAGNKTLGIRYTLDENNCVIGFTTGGVNYYFAKNLQGDVLEVYNASTNEVVAQYTYDSWGNILTATGSMAETNPFRYRGYYYDGETGFYYVSSRYYDPAIGRFINADDTDYLGADGSPLSYNLFAYCMNNPVNRFDAYGNWSMPNWAKVAIGAVATVAAVAVTVATGGAAAPVLLGVVANTITSGAIGYATGGVEGMKDGLANGFMMGGLSALGGSLVSAGIKAVKTARQGITIGRGMDKVNRAAGLTDTATYSSDALWKPLNGSYYNGIKKIFGEKAANAVSCACNKLYIKTMRTLGAVIYDSGLNGYAQAGQFYGMELEVLEGYANLVQMY